MRTRLCIVTFISLLFILGACSKLGAMKINVVGKSRDTTPVIQTIDPETPKKGDVVTLKGNNFKGPSLQGVIVLSDNSQIKVTITVTGDGEGIFHLDEDLPEGVKILQVLILNKDGVLTSFSVPSGTTSSAAVAPPIFSPAAGAYGSAQTVALTTTTEGAEIFYTLDGKDPDSSAQKYQSPITVSQSLTIKAIAVKSGKDSSTLGSAAYTINGAAATPVASLSAGIYASDQTVTLTTATEGATILYTTDGSAPSDMASVYTGPLTITGNTTLKTIAVKSGYSASAVLSVNYVLKATAPIASIPGDFYTSRQNVTLTTTTVGASIYYTIDGSTPSVSSTLYTGPISIVGKKTLQAVAIKAGYTASNILSEDYRVILQLMPPSAANSDGVGMGVVGLTNGNIVVAKPYADVGGVSDAGSVSLYNGTTGVLISTITGSRTGDRVGSSIAALTNGNFVIQSPNWDCQASLGCSGTIVDVGAATWVNGSTGLSGVVNTTNSLVGSSASDQIGAVLTGLSNGHYVVQSKNWDCQAALGCSGTVVDVGAATWGDGTTGIAGFVTTSNSLVGSTANDQIGYLVKVLTNSNYVVASESWDCQAALGCSGTVADVGAVTWGNGTTGITGFVTTANSLVGSTASDGVGGWILALSNGHYVVQSLNWDCQASLGCSGTIADVGAVTWGHGATGVVGFVSASNSLVGSTANDKIGNVTTLTNGNYVVSSPTWDCQASLGCPGTITNVGAVTWGNGTTGITGFVDASNSLVGSTASDQVGFGVLALSNGNFVVRSPFWDCQASLGCSGSVVDGGAATWGNGTTGITGVVNTSNSLVGSNSDLVGLRGFALTNGNYVVASSGWDCQVASGCSGAIADVGAVTWGNGTTGITGTINTSNSLVGSTAGDVIGDAVTVLTNGNYVVTSQSWNCQASLGCSGAIARVGAVTWGNGTTGTTGTINTSNSLVGSTAYDYVGSPNVLALSNGNYVVQSYNWDCQASLGCSGSVVDAGAVTWGNGTTGVVGFVNSSNSLVGSTASDYVGMFDSVIALTNGHYVVLSTSWDCQASSGCSGSVVDAGAVTWGNGTTGVAGLVNTSNSFVGSSASDQIGSVTALSNGNYVVSSRTFDSAANTDVGLAFVATGSSSMFGIIPN